MNNNPKQEIPVNAEVKLIELKEREKLYYYMRFMTGPKMLGYTRTWNQWSEQFVKMMNYKLIADSYKSNPEKIQECEQALKTFSTYPSKLAGDIGLDSFVCHFQVFYAK